MIGEDKMHTIWMILTANSFIFLFSIIVGIIACAKTIYDWSKRKICSVIGLFIRILITAIIAFLASWIALNILYFLYRCLVNYGVVIIVIIAVILIFSLK